VNISSKVERERTSGIEVATFASRLSGKGLAAAAGSFAIWGLLPVYLKPLHDVPALQIIAHRVAWSCLFILGWMLVHGEIGKLRATLKNPATLRWLAITAVLISTNWLVYVWAVGHGHVVETSLGYFINPLVNVVLGVAILRERLNSAQWTAVAIAAIAVVYLSLMIGRPPWIALSLALSFSLYGFLRKIISAEALPGLATETFLLLPFAVAYLAWCEAAGSGVMGHSTPSIHALLVGCGPVTAVPLFLFAYGARLIPYSTVGLLQYIAPSLQLAGGLFLYHEPFERTRAVGFVLIWVALLIFAADSLWRRR
jgi:chloramphenicol-sensitive protein RarD